MEVQVKAFQSWGTGGLKGGGGARGRQTGGTGAVGEELGRNKVTGAFRRAPHTVRTPRCVLKLTTGAGKESMKKS